MSKPGPVDGARWVPLTKGKYALVDDADYEMVTQYRWHCQDVNGGRLRGRITYARRSFGYTRVEGGKRRLNVQQMQALILGVITDKLNVVDHIDGDTLNNRRSNLRLATTQQNCTHRTRGNRGSVQLAASGKWHAYGSRKVYIGVYATEEEARSASAMHMAQTVGEEFAPAPTCEPKKISRKEACPIGVCACGRKLGLKAMRPARIAARGGAKPQCAACHCRAIAAKGGAATANKMRAR